MISCGQLLILLAHLVRGQLVSREHFVNMMFFSTDLYILDHANFLRPCVNTIFMQSSYDDIKSYI